MLVLTLRKGRKVFCVAGAFKLTIRHENWIPEIAMVSLSVHGEDYFLSCTLSEGRSVKVPIGTRGDRLDTAWVEICFVGNATDGQRIGFSAPRWWISIIRDNAGPRKQPTIDQQTVDPSVETMPSLTPDDQPAEAGK